MNSDWHSFGNTSLTAVAFVVYKRTIPFALLRTVVVVVVVSSGEISFGFALFWSRNELMMPLTAVTACVSILAFLHIVTKSQAIKTLFISFQNVSSFSGILNNIARGRIMHVSTKDTFAFAALTLLWDQRTEKWGLITKFGMSQCLGWFSVLACFRHLAIFITFENSSRVPSYLQSNLGQQFGHNDWN